MNIIKFGLKRVLLKFNLDVRRIGADSRSLQQFAEADPITFQYLSNLKIAAPLNISLSRARAGIMGFSYEKLSSHPFVQAFAIARKHFGTSERDAAVRQLLSSYYAAVQPASALEVVDLNESEAPGLLNIPIQSWVFPWSERSIAETANHRRICLEEEGLAKGSMVSIADGATLFGPVSDRKLMLETQRVCSLSDSLHTKGFREDPASPIEVIGLRSGKDYRWLVVQGQHRLAACAAFDVPEVPAHIVRIIRRDDVEFWPHVVSKTFTAAGALKCFDRLFAGKLPACAFAWQPKIDKAA